MVGGKPFSSTWIAKIVQLLTANFMKKTAKHLYLTVMVSPSIETLAHQINPLTSMQPRELSSATISTYVLDVKTSTKQRHHR